MLTDIAITELISSSSEKLTALSGGRNHAVYLYDDLGERLCLKRFQSAKNKQARNEWNSLHALHNFTEGIAPEPLRFIEGLDGSCVIAMEYVAGQRLSDVENVSREQLHALAAVMKTMYSMPVSDSSYKYEQVNCSSACMLSRVRQFFANEDHCRVRGEQASDVWELGKGWVFGQEAERLMLGGERVFSRGDPNLANCLWDGNALRLVDFEYAGVTDRAFDLADLTEHVNAARIDEKNWQWFVEPFELSANETVRFAASRKLASLFWLTRLWPIHETEAELAAFNSQGQRVIRWLG
ncbi:Thiamine kinase [Paenibacillus solanacearum]|uniref:Thiamine kinase n=1 Tax=Paenibacillus solanacearum TaxID=2048548 RepID=A0A916JRT2_9BACL|nr:phosphotransferase [Paenibacillus solanacearum]CAG7595026.1 Thiamine kinase [Paenibacillus solanacearum]